ncbi:MAG: oligosaccharide flippase family protein, partial [Candidatus Nitrosocaldus sp.]
SMDKPFERLARGSLYLLLGNIITSIVGALFWIVLAKMLDAEHIGQAMIVIAFTASIIAFASSGMQTALAKYISEYNAKGEYAKTRRVIKMGLILSLLISTVVGIVLFFLSDSISTIYGSSEGIAFLIAFASLSYIPANAVVASISSIYTAYHRTQYVLLTTTIFQASRLTASIALASYGFYSLAIIAGFSIASIINAVIGYVIMQRISKHDYAREKVKRERRVEVGEEEEDDGIESRINVKALLAFSGFNYIATGLRTLRNQIGVLTVGTSSIELSAFYGISSLIANVVGQVMLSIASMMLPTASEEITKGNKDGVKHLFSIAMRIALVLNGFLVLLLLIEPTYILRMISHSYVEASDALRLLVIAYLINSTSNIMASLLNAINRAKDIAVRESVASAIIIALTPVLVPILGMEGAALALLIGSLTNLILSYMLINKQGFTIHMDVYRAPLSIAAAFTLGYIVLVVYSNTLIALILALAVHALLSLAVKAITRKEISTIISVIITRGR